MRGNASESRLGFTWPWVRSAYRLSPTNSHPDLLSAAPDRRSRSQPDCRWPPTSIAATIQPGLHDSRATSGPSHQAARNPAQGGTTLSHPSIMGGCARWVMKMGLRRRWGSPILQSVWERRSFWDWRL